jgi:hypothetical protein
MAESTPRIPSRDDIRRILDAGDDAPSASAMPSADEQLRIVDALYRFGAGQDLRDRALFESAFAADAALDFTGPAQRLGATVPVFSGRTAIADTVFATIGDLDTTHTVTNPRVTAFAGDRATLSALVEAQHLPHDDHGRHLLLKNVYVAELVKRAGRWLIERLQIDNVWLDGDPSVLFPATARDVPLENPHA